MSKVILLLFLLFSFLDIYAQKGSVKGVVKEKGSNENIPGANIIIKGTFTGTSSDFSGKFELSDMNPGAYTLQVSFISYQTKEVENVVVKAGRATELVIELESESLQLQTIEVTAELRKSRESTLLLEQQKAPEIVQHIGAQELARKGVGDVAAAVTKVTGISKLEGSNQVYVRGLGDRYNSTTLNGLPIPSNNPEEKNISLELFTIDIVEYISIDKTYNNRMFGDFAGGNVDINTKEHKGDPYINVGMGIKVNTNSIDERIFPQKQGPGYFGFYTIKPPTTISVFDFKTPYETVNRTAVANSFSLSGANEHKTSKEKEFNYFFTLNFDNDFNTKEGFTRSVNSTGYPSKDFQMKTFDYSTNTTAMINLGYRPDKKNKLNLNLLFINSSSNSNEDYRGTILDIADYDNGLLIRRTYEKNTVFINQLIGSHDFGAKKNLNWGLSFNKTLSDIPDRIQNTFRGIENNQWVFGQNQITDNHRYYHYLKEDEAAANITYDYKFLNDSLNTYKLKLSFGAIARLKNREFNATQYNFRVNTDQRNTIVDPENISSFFNQENLEKGNYYRIETFRGSSQVPFALNPQVYGGTQIVPGLFLTTEYHLSPKMLLLIGLRSEYLYQEVRWNTQLDPSDKSDAFSVLEFLPNISGKYEISKRQNLRFAASKTYTLPQFKERALFIYEEVTQVKIGNPALYKSDNYNIDLKWEFFPSIGEIVSLTTFGKYVLNPINEVTISSATNDISFLNTGDRGYVAGMEFELRKNIFNFYSSRLLTGFNTTWMHTTQDLNSDKIAKETIYRVQFSHDEASFTGASDLLMNADISYLKYWNEHKNAFMTTLSYQYFSDRVYALGTNARGNIIDKAFGTLDLIVKSDFNNLSLGLSLKNLLNPNVERYQANLDQDILIMSYKKGVQISFSIAYQFK